MQLQETPSRYKARLGRPSTEVAAPKAVPSTPISLDKHCYTPDERAAQTTLPPAILARTCTTVDSRSSSPAVAEAAEVATAELQKLDYLSTAPVGGECRTVVVRV